jgi:hypothetical protein
MGLFDLFKKPQIIQDNFFGPLRFIEFKNSTKNYFEGKAIFKPTGNEIEYFIKADLSGPTTDQRDFYDKVQNSYDEIISKVIPIIEDELKDWKEDSRIKDFKKEFKPVALTIPRMTTKPLIWDISFETIHDDNHHVTIDFKDFEPDGSAIDG